MAHEHLIASAAEPAVLEVRGVSKRFPGVLANDNISLRFRAGEVHALLGENGAGKSTLLAMLAGMQRPDSGRILVDGRPVNIPSPQHALQLGIGAVYQHTLLVPSLSVLDNLLLGTPWWRPLARRAALKRYRELAAALSLSADPAAPLGRLSLGQQQLVEIVRALWHKARVLILDEPTSMLTPAGVAELMTVVARLRERGVAVIFITHKLGEAYQLADRIAVLRRGRVVGAIDREQLKDAPRQVIIDTVVGLMFDRSETDSLAARSVVGQVADDGASRLPTITRDGPPALELKAASTRGEAGECPLRDVHLQAWPGEALGVAGVDGNGQKHLAEALAGQRPLSAGTLRLGGRDLSAGSSWQRRQAGVRYVTDERLGEGTVADHAVATNLVLKDIGRPPFWRAGLTRWGAIAGHARRQIERYQVRTPSEHTAVGKLSGGNIQKIVLAREVSTDARLLIFNKPTYGLDLDSTLSAWARIRAIAGQAAVVVVISNELEELLTLCHRIAVLEGGAIRGVVDNTGSAAEAEIGRLMTGSRRATA